MRARRGGLLPRALAFVVGVSVLASGVSAQAQPNTPAESVPNAPPAVRIIIVGEAPESLDDRISSWFPAGSMVTSVSRQQTLDPLEVLHPVRRSPVGVWVVVREPGARLFFSVETASEAGAPRYLTSDLELEHGLDEVGMEQLAQVVYFSSLALWRGEAESARHDVERALELGPLAAPAPTVDPVVPEVPAPAAPAAEHGRGPFREPGSSWHLHTGFEYVARVRGAEGLGHGPGALFALLRSKRETRAGARLHLDYLLPARPSRRDIELELRGYSVQLGAFFSAPVDSFFVDAELGAGLDLVRYSTYSVNAPGFRSESGGVDTRPIVCAGLGLGTNVGPFRIGLSARLTMQLLSTHYDVAEPVGRSELIDPFMVQPGLALEISY